MRRSTINEEVDRRQNLNLQRRSRVLAHFNTTAYSRIVILQNIVGVHYILDIVYIL